MSDYFYYYTTAVDEHVNPVMLDYVRSHGQVVKPNVGYNQKWDPSEFDSLEEEMEELELSVYGYVDYNVNPRDVEVEDDAVVFEKSHSSFKGTFTDNENVLVYLVKGKNQNTGKVAYLGAETSLEDVLGYALKHDNLRSGYGD